MYGAVFGDIMGSWYEWHNRKSEDIELFPREARLIRSLPLRLPRAFCIWKITLPGSATRTT